MKNVKFTKGQKLTDHTNYKRVSKKHDDDIIFDEDAPYTNEAFWAEALAELEKPKQEKITLNLDSDVIAKYRALGRGYQRVINKLLRLHAQKFG